MMLLLCQENRKELSYLEKKYVAIVIGIRKAHFTYTMNHRLELVDDP